MKTKIWAVALLMLGGAALTNSVSALSKGGSMTQSKEKEQKIVVGKKAPDFQFAFQPGQKTLAQRL